MRHLLSVKCHKRIIEETLNYTKLMMGDTNGAGGTQKLLQDETGKQNAGKQFNDNTTLIIE